MEEEAVLEANKNLSEKIRKLEAEVKLLWMYKEKYDSASRAVEELRKDLFHKRSVVRVVQKKDNINYVLIITKAEDTPEGMFIEVV